jgi:transposase
LEKRKVYSTAEKRSVVRAVQAGMRVSEAMVAYNISSRSTIRSWINAFSKENMEISSSKPTEMPKKITPETENAAIKALKMELAEANLKIKALDTMIDIAEEHLKIDIRKKSGARQSSK